MISSIKMFWLNLGRVTKINSTLNVHAAQSSNLKIVVSIKLESRDMFIKVLSLSVGSKPGIPYSTLRPDLAKKVPLSACRKCLESSPRTFQSCSLAQRRWNQYQKKCSELILELAAHSAPGGSRNKHGWSDMKSKIWNENFKLLPHIFNLKPTWN